MRARSGNVDGTRSPLSERREQGGEDKEGEKDAPQRQRSTSNAAKTSPSLVDRPGLRRTKSLEARALRMKLRQEEEEREERADEERRREMEERRKKHEDELRLIKEEEVRVMQEYEMKKARRSAQVVGPIAPDIPDLSTLSISKPSPSPSSTSTSPSPSTADTTGFCDAIRWAYNPSSTQFSPVRTRVRMGDALAKPGRFRTPHWMEDEREREKLVGKVFKPEFDKEPGAIRRLCFCEAQVDMKAKEYADAYNRKDVPEKVIYPEVYVYDIFDESGLTVAQTICAEEFYLGSFVKYVDNKGLILVEGNNTVEAFIHYTYEASYHSEMVVDIQKIGTCYTDPLIATAAGNTGDGDFGAVAMRTFMDAHVCNGICFSIIAPTNHSSKLQPLTKGVVPASLIDSFFSPATLILPAGTKSIKPKSFGKITLPSSPVRVVCFGRSGVAQLADDTVKAFTSSTGVLQYYSDVTVHSAPTALCAHGNVAFIGCSDGSITVFDMSKSKNLQVLREHSDTIHSLACDDKYLFASTKTGKVKKWNITDLRPILLRFFKEIATPVLACTNGGLFVSVHNAIYWLDQEGVNLRFKFKHEAFSIRHFCVVGKKLVATDHGYKTTLPSLLVWDLTTREFICKVDLSSPAVALYPCGDRKCLVGLQDSSIQLWSVSPLALDKTLCEHMHEVQMSYLFVDHKHTDKPPRLLTCGEHLKIWTVKDHK